MPIYSYDVVSGGEEAANPSVAEQEQDVMRDLLDTVSTTATRASSIAGSLLDLESRAGSVTGETGRQTNYSFSEPGNENFQYFTTFIENLLTFKEICLNYKCSISFPLLLNHWKG